MSKSSSARVARSSKAIVVAAFVGFACSVNAAIVGSTGGTFIPPGSWGVSVFLWARRIKHSIGLVSSWPV